jgi:subtilisin family serine protease
MKGLGPWLALAALMLQAAWAGDGAPAHAQILVTFKQEQTTAPPRTGPRAKYLGGSRRYATSLKVDREVKAVAREQGLRPVDAWPIAPLGVHCVVFEITGPRPVQDVLAALASDPRVESAQPLQIFDVLASDLPVHTGVGPAIAPDDAAAVGVALSGRGYDDPYRELQLEEAQRWASGRGIDVAVIDTGIDVHHPELAGRIALSEDFVDPPAHGGEQHGTAIAGIIAADAGNGIGIIGVAPDVELLALRACWPVADKSVCSSFTLAKALTFALERAPQIINLSLAGPQDPLLERLLQLVVARGITVVAACRTPQCDSFPASVPEVIAVSDMEPAGGWQRVAAPAEPGVQPALAQTPARAGALPLVAPGTDVITTMPNGAFDFVSGSSISAAHVSGIIALLLQRRPDLNATSLRQALASSAHPDGPAAGVVNACAALAALVDGAACPAVDNVAGRG